MMHYIYSTSNWIADFRKRAGEVHCKENKVTGSRVTYTELIYLDYSGQARIMLLRDTYTLV